MPIPEYHVIPLVYSFAGIYEDHSTYYPSRGTRQFPQTEPVANPYSRPHAQTSKSAPEIHGHQKNVSISTHLDMFSLNEQDPYDTAPTNRHAPSQPLFGHSSLFQEYARLPYATQLRSTTHLLELPHQHHVPSGYVPHAAPRQPSPEHSHESKDSIQLTTQPSKSMPSKLLREIVKVDAFNLNSFLLSVLNEIRTPLPLDDFYNLLYNHENNSSFALQNDPQGKIDRTTMMTSSDSLSVLQLILDVFREPQVLLSYSPSIDMSGCKLSSVNYHELLRSFLALKILFDSLVEVNEGPKSLELPTLPRLSIYKMYYILCQKLILKYPTESNSTSSQQKLILGQSKLGKFIKLVYPNLLSKRLGRRGESKYNYLGVKWNTNVVREEIIDLCDKDLPMLADLFKNQKKALDLQLKRPLPYRQLVSQRRSSHHRRQSNVSTAFNSSTGISDSRIRPQVTYVRSYTKFPFAGFSPLSLASDPENIDPQTSWLGAARHHSLLALQDFGINLQMIRNYILNEERMNQDDNWLFRELAVKIEMILQSDNREDKKYLHLFLILAIDLLPIILIYEPTGERKLSIVLIKNNLKMLVSKLGPKFSGNPLVDSGDMKAITGVMKRMIHLTDLLESFCKPTLNSELLADMRSDVESLSQTAVDVDFDGDSHISQSRLIITQSVLRVIHSYQSLLNDDGEDIPADRVIEIVNDDARILLDDLIASLKRFIDKIANALENEPNLPLQNISKQISIQLVELIHTNVITERLAKHYPIPMFKDMVTNISNHILTFFYQHKLEQGIGRPNLSFRHWWIISTYFQEYFALLSELVGLHESLT